MSEVETENVVTSEDEAALSSKLVPVSESIRYRKRAQSAEKKVAMLENDIAKAQSESERLGETLRQLEAEHQLTRKLVSAGVKDLETALLLAKSRIQDAEGEDVDRVIEQLRKEKEYLFADSTVPGGSTKTAGVKQRNTGGQNVLERAAKKAATSGSRTDLLKYLKLRRNFV